LNLGRKTTNIHFQKIEKSFMWNAAIGRGNIKSGYPALKLEVENLSQRPFEQKKY